MKKTLLLAILACALCLAPYSAMGQSKSKSKTAKTKSGTSSKKISPPSFGDVAAPIKSADDNSSKTEVKPTTAKDAKSGGSTGGDAAGIGGFDIGFDFDLMRADSIEIDPDGVTVMTNNVRIESKEINISCVQLKVDNKTKKMFCTGGPVKMDKPGLVAECRNFTYFLDSKNMVFEDSAQIINQDSSNGKKTQIKADVIKIDQPPAGGGKPKMSLITRTGVPPEIRSLGNDNTAAAKPKSSGPTPVGENNLDALKLPNVP